MPRPPRLASPRGLRVAALAAAPVVLALSVPAVAAPGVAVTAAAEGCGVVVTLDGLGEGSHSAVVRTTVLASGDPVPVVLPVEATPAPEPTATTPVLAAESTVTGDGEVLVVLDAAAVPDTDPRVSVAVTLDGEASAVVELALPGCGAPPTGEPTPTPTTEPTAPPSTPPPTTPPVEQPQPTAPPEQPATPSLPTEGLADSPTDGPTPEPASPAPTSTSTSTSTSTPTPTSTSTLAPPTASSTPAPSASPRPSTTPTPSTVTPSGPAPDSPVLVSTPAPRPTPSVDVVLDQAYSAFDLGSGTSGYLSLMSFTAAPQLDAAVAPDAVPAPVIAAPDGSAAGVVAAPQGSAPRFEDVLPDAPDASDDEPVTAQLAAPELATGTAADPLVDLAPAAFVLSASLGGLLMAGRRRTP